MDVTGFGSLRQRVHSNHENFTKQKSSTFQAKIAHGLVSPIRLL